MLPMRIKVTIIQKIII